MVFPFSIRGDLTQYRDTFAATGANILGSGTQKTRAPLSPGQSSSLKFPAKADLTPRSGQLEVPNIG